MKTFIRSLRVLGLILFLAHNISTSVGQQTVPVAVADSYSTAPGAPLVISAPGVLFNDTHRPVKILPLGDSITRGTHSTLGAIPGGYRKQLATRLAQSGMSFDFVGSRTDNPAPGMDPDHDGVNSRRTDQVITALPSLLAGDPDIVLLHIGTNDILADLPVATAVANLATLIDQITTGAPDRRLYVSTIIPITQSFGNRSAAALNADVDAYNIQVRNHVQTFAAQGRKVVLVDLNATLVYTNAADPNDNFFQAGDGIHPGQAGSDQMGDLWYFAMRRHLPLTSLTSALVSSPSNGSLTLASDGSFTYSPAAGFSGTDSFTYRASNSASNSNIANVSITVTSSSTAISSGSFELGTPADFGTLTGWNASGAIFGYTQNSPYLVKAGNGSRVAMFNGGTDNFTGVITQSFSTTPGATYTLSFDLGITGSANKKARLLIDVTDGPETNGDSLLSAAEEITTNGATTFWGPTKVYSFIAASGSTTLRFSDGSGALPIAVSTFADLSLDNVVVNSPSAAASSAPVADADFYATPPGTQLVIAAGGVLANDTDPGNAPLTAILASGTTHGNISLNADGSFTYTPQSGFTGQDSFTYRASNGTLSSNLVTVFINVTLTTLMNGSFEEGTMGWTASGSYVVISAQGNYVPNHLSKLLVLNGANSQPNGSLSQTFPTVPGEAYQLSFDLGNLAINSNNQQLQVTLNGSTQLLNQTFTLTGNGAGNSVWSTRSYAFIANSNSTTLSFNDISTVTAGIDLLLDNVRITRTPAAGIARLLTVVAPQVSSAPITVSQADLGGLASGATLLTRAYNNGQLVTLTAAPIVGNSNFSKWQKNGVDLATNATVSVTMDASFTLTAVYLPTAPGTLSNGSFESYYTGWTRSGTVGVETGATYKPTDGAIVVSFNSGNSTNSGIISQTVATTPGATYSLMFDAGVLAYNNAQQRMKVTVTGSGTLLDRTLVFSGKSNGTLWFGQSFTFIANSNTSTVSFADLSTNTNAIDLLLDHVRIAHIPSRFILSVNSLDANGVSIAMSPNDIIGSGSGTTDMTRYFNSGTTVNLTAPATSGSASFVKWRRNNVDFSTNRSISLLINATNILTAVYAVPDSSVLANGSLETGLTGWTSSGNIALVSSTPYVASNGSSLITFNAGNSVPNGVLSQTFSTVPGTTYNLTFDAGTFAYNTQQQKLQVVATGSGTLLDSVVTLTAVNGSTTWKAQSFTFIANSTTTTLTFTDVSTVTSDIDLTLDNIRVVAQPTEPAPGGSAMGVAVLSGTPGAVRIGVQATVPGTYRLERSVDLVNWVPYGSAIAITSATVGPIEFQDNEPPAPARFYRIARLPGN